MNTNQRFAISVHALTLLAANDEPLTSEAIASSVDTNPVVIRRTMASLREHGLVESKPGAHGGWRLLRRSNQIVLRDVYRCLGGDDILAIHSHPNKNCPIGGKITTPLKEIFDHAQTDMEKSLANHTVADILTNIRKIKS